MQLEGESSEDLPLHELLDLDKQLRSVKGSLKVEVAKKVQLKKFYGRYQDLIEKYRRSVNAMVSDSFPGQFLFNM